MRLEITDNVVGQRVTYAPGIDNREAAREKLPVKLNVKPVEPKGDATVTVVIPCYNYARYLPQAVGSVLSQAGAIVNVIIVDDKSTDDSLAVAESLAARDERVIVVAHQVNKGPVETFNDGLALADGEFVVRLDADDLLTPGSLSRSIAVLQQFPNVGLVYGHPIHFDGAKLPKHRDHVTSWTIWNGRNWLEARCRDGLNVITSPEVVMRRSVVDEVGGQMNLAHTHDMEMWFRLAAFCDVGYIRGSDQAWHREHARSLSSREVNAVRDLHERRDAFETLFAGKAGALSQADDLHELAKFAMARQALELAIRRFDKWPAGADDIGPLREFAGTLTSDVRSVPGWSDLERRIGMGGERAKKHPLFMLERAFRGLRGRYSFWKWHRTGEF